MVQTSMFSQIRLQKHLVDRNAVPDSILQRQFDEWCDDANQSGCDVLFDAISSLEICHLTHSSDNSDFRQRLSRIFCQQVDFWKYNHNSNQYKVVELAALFCWQLWCIVGNWIVKHTSDSCRSRCNANLQLEEGANLVLYENCFWRLQQSMHVFHFAMDLIVDTEVKQKHYVFQWLWFQRLWIFWQYLHAVLL